MIAARLARRHLSDGVKARPQAACTAKMSGFPWVSFVASIPHPVDSRAAVVTQSSQFECSTGGAVLDRLRISLPGKASQPVRELLGTGIEGQAPAES
jgi:uncharacterized lipoprotein YbaY